MDFKRRLTECLKLNVPYNPAFTCKGTSAGVLILFGDYILGDQAGITLLLTRRTDTVETHKGQIAFPGGVHDLTDESIVATALRETEEEIGISRSLINVLGVLPVFCTITGFSITPVIGVLDRPIDELQLKINPHEIAEVIWTPLRVLKDTNTYRQEWYSMGDRRYPIHVFQVGVHRVWGATGSMIRNLLDRVQQVQYI